MRRAWIALVAVPAALVAALARLGSDYGNLGCHLAAPRCDEPAWPLEALARGDVGTFVRDQPLMGPAGMVLRAPFAAATRLFGAGLTWHYRAGLFPCLAILALLALALARRSRARGHPWVHTAALAALTFVSPLVISAIDAGHPEELVAAAGVVAAALFVLDRRWLLAAVVLGLAVATKAWAILAVAPLVVAVVPAARLRFAAVAVALVLVLYLPLAVADPGRFGAVVQAAGSLGSHYGEASAPDAWFPAASAGDFVWASGISDGQIDYVDATGYRVPLAVARAAHALVFALSLALAVAWWRAGGARLPESLMLVLAAILLLRCALDPGDHVYYHAAPAAALLGWEALRPRARFPWLAAGFIGAVWALDWLQGRLPTDADFAWVYLGVALPALTLILGLALITCRRSRSTPPTRRSPISRRPATGSSRG